MAAAYFNAHAPAGWSATSAGVTPQTLVSERLAPLLRGTDAETFVDNSPPRPLGGPTPEPARRVAIDTSAPGSEEWQLATDQPMSDEDVRDEIRRRVDQLIKDLADTPAV